MVDDTAIFVGERSKTEDIDDRFIAIICNDIRALLCAVRWAGVIRDDVGANRGKPGEAIYGTGAGRTIAPPFCFGQVLLMPWRGRFMWPLAVAKLGLRYLSIKVSDKLGRPLSNP